MTDLELVELIVKITYSGALIAVVITILEAFFGKADKG